MNSSILKYSAFLALTTSVMLYAFDASANYDDRIKENTEKVKTKTLEEKITIEDSTSQAKYTRNQLKVD